MQSTKAEHPDQLEELAQELYSAFLREQEEGRDVDFEAYCARFPHVAETLRAIHRDLARFESAEDEIQFLPRPGAGTDGRFVSLHAGLLDSPADEIERDLLERLAAESPKSWPFQDFEIVGNGAFGVVYRVRQGVLRRRIALKTLRHWLAEGEGTPGQRKHHRHRLVRFLVEVQILAQLDHPGIVPLHDAGVDAAGKPYFTMRLVRGRDLTQVIRAIHQGKEDWTLGRGLEVLLKVCDAVSYAHSRNVVHRDLKPDNVRVGRYGEVYVMDWGLARVVAGDRAASSLEEELLSDSIHTLQRLVRSGEDVEAGRADKGASHDISIDGTVIGSPSYMSPEQAHGDRARIDSRTDVYSLGAILYHLLSGWAPYQRPHRSSTAEQIVQRVLVEPPDPLSKVAPAVVPELAAICDKAMERDPERRYQTVGRLAADLRAFLDGRVVSAYGGGRYHELRKWAARNRGLTAGTLGAATALLLGLGGSAVVLAVKNREISATEERFTERDRMTDDSLRQMRLFAHEENGGWSMDRGARIELVDALQNSIESRVFGTDDPEFKVRNMVSVGFGRMGQGRLATARSVFEDALELLGGVRDEHVDEERAERTENLARLGLLYVDAFDRRFTAGRERAEVLLAALDEPNVDRVDALMAASILEHNAGRLERAHSYVKLAQAILENLHQQREQARALAPAGTYIPRIQMGALLGQRANVELRLALERGDPVLLGAAVRSAEELAAQSGRSFERALADVMIARGRLAQGDYLSAEVKAREALELLTEHSGVDSVHTLHLGTTLADVLLRRGTVEQDPDRVEEGFEMYREAIRRADLARESDRNGATIRLRGRFAAALTRYGKRAEALEAFAEWQALLRAEDPMDPGLEHMRLYLLWAELLLAGGDASPAALEQAGTLLVTAQEIATRIALHEERDGRFEGDVFAWHPGEVTALRAHLAQVAGEEAAAEKALAALRSELAERPDDRRRAIFEERLGLRLGD